MNLAGIIAGINDRHPHRNWRMMCQALVFWAGVVITGSDKRWTYERAIWAYDESHIESHDPLIAPAGAIHYWLYPEDHGHVAIELGGGVVLMTGTPHELGEAGTQYGTNYGTTTVASFMARDTQTYLGWSLTNGTNASLTPYFDTAPQPPPTEEEEEEMERPMTIGIARNGAQEIVTFWPQTGQEETFQSSWDTVDAQSYNRNVALAYNCPPSSPIVYISKSHYDKIRAANAAKRDRTAGAQQ